MNLCKLGLAALAPLGLFGCTLCAQDARPSAQTPVTTLSVQANLVLVPAVVYDRKSPVTTLSKDSFALTVDGKPQVIRYFDRDTDVPLTVGLLVDVSRSVANQLDEEQKASETFLESMLAPAAGTRPADKAFVMQFGRTAELLQDVTASHPLLEAGLKEIGTEAPGSADTDADDTQQGSNGNNGNSNGNGNGNGGSGNPNGYPGSGRGGYGRNNPNGTGANSRNQSRGGTVLYDALYLASREVMAKQTGRRAVILLTDGEDRHSKESLTEAIEAAQRADTVVYAIFYKGEQHYNGYPGGRRGYGGYPGYGYPGGGYPGGNYPGSGGRPGSDGTYAPVDGKKILERICGETGGQVFEAKGKGSVEKIYQQIGDELRATYRLGFSPTGEAAAPGYHKLQLTLTTPEGKKMDIQTREGYYTGPSVRH